MADGQTKTDDVTAVNVQGSSSANIDMTMDEAARTAPTDGPTPESLNVSQEQFDKFYSADKGYNWEAHARELQFQNEQRAAKGDDQKAPADQTKAAGDADQADNKTDDNTIDWNALGAKIGEGTFGDEDKQRLMKLGIPENIVDEYVNVLQQNVEMHFQNVERAFGGKERMGQIFQAAQAQLNEQELEQVEKMLADPAQFRVAADALMARVGAAGPTGVPNANLGNPADQPQPYKSQAEMLADQRNPKYRTDPAFREQVWRRAAASTFDQQAAHTL